MSKKVLALTLALLLCLSMPLVSFAAPDTEANEVATGTGAVEGDGDYQDIVFKVVVPTKVGFSLDPFQISGDVSGGQITSVDFPVINKNSIPVSLTYDLAIVASESDAVSFVEDVADVDIDGEEGKREMFFGAIVASTVTGATFSGTTITSATYTATETSSLIVGFAPAEASSPTDGKTKAEAQFTLALGAGVATATPTVASDLNAAGEGATAFRFYGKLNTNAEWKADLVKVTGTYTLKPYMPAKYTSLKYVEGSRLVEGTGGGGGPKLGFDNTTYNIPVAASFDLPFAMGSYTASDITKVVVVEWSNWDALANAGKCAIGTDTVTMKCFSATGDKGKTYNVIVTMAGKDYPTKIVFNA